MENENDIKKACDFEFRKKNQNASSSALYAYCTGHRQSDSTGTATISRKNVRGKLKTKKLKNFLSIAFYFQVRYFS